jgi:Fe-S oxidoreductase
VNAVGHAPGLHWLATRLAGLENREVPLFASQTLQQWWQARNHDPGRPAGDRGTVLLWPDTFTNAFAPHIGRAAVALLEDAGWQVEMPTEPLCCGLTWISTGQLSVAKKVLQRTIAALAPHLRDGGYVVGLEPSCTAVFRSDAPEMFPTDQDVHRLRDHTVTLAELLTEHTPGWTPPPVAGQAPGPVQALAQVHCHQHAVLGWDADEQLLKSAGVDVEHLESGCCGLAGNFGFTAGHGEVSEALAEQVLLPRLRDADPATVVLADGFSCRTQIHDLDSGGRQAVHLAELLATGLPTSHESSAGAPLRTTGGPPVAPSRLARGGALGAAGLTATGTAVLAAWTVRAAVTRLARPRGLPLT